MTRYARPGDTAPAMVLGTLLRVLVEAGRIGQDGADTLAALAIPESSWGPRVLDLESAVRQAAEPRTWRRHLPEPKT